jgi:uncharacterized protein YndB with AHSA1/START domain
MDKATCEVRFTRHYDSPPAEVWATLTEPESVTRWLAPSVRLDPSEGASFGLRLGDAVIRGSVRAVVPERVLELDWIDGGDESIVRFELSPDGDGTRLVLDHSRIAAQVGMAAMERWSRALGRLQLVVTRPEVRS